MSVLPWFSAGDPLPDPSALTSGAFQLRSVADRLSGHASAIRGVSQRIGPGVWVDSSSGRAKALLSGLADELDLGSEALRQSADAIAALAGYVSSVRGEYDHLGAQIASLEHTPVGTGAAHAMIEMTSLADQRQSIESQVSARMAHTADIITQWAARAPRHGGSIWSKLWDALGGAAHGVENGAIGLAHLVADLASGVWDGTTELAGVVVAVVVEAARLSPERMALDPAGYQRDLAQFIQGGEAIADTAVHHPLAFLKTITNYQELSRDPVHWLGALVPTVVLGLLTDGAGLSAKVADASGAATRLSIRDLVTENPDLISRYEGNGFGHTISHGHINTNPMQSNENFIRSLIQRNIQNGSPRLKEGVFASRERGNSVLRYLLQQNEQGIEQWLNNSNGVAKLTLDNLQWSGPVGLVMKVGELGPRPSDLVTIVLRKSIDFPEGFYIRTSFPQW